MRSTSTSSTSGSTATVAAEVWILPLDSVSGTRCTLCAPLSYLSLEYAPFPFMRRTASLMPPSPVSLSSISSVFQRLRSAYLVYILKRSAPNSAASSPPVPALISRITFFSSLGSFGRRSTLSSSSCCPISSSSSEISIFASSRISSSPSSRISLASARSAFAFLYSLYFFTIGSISPISLTCFCHTG